MGLETNPIYIPDLNPAWPLGSDPISQGDDHIRNTKVVLTNQLSNLGYDAVTATAAQINAFAGRETGRGGFYVDDGDAHIHTLSGGNWVTLTPSNSGAVLPGGFNVTASPSTGVIALVASSAVAVAYINYALSARLQNASPGSGHYQFRTRVIRASGDQIPGSKTVEEVDISNDPYIYKSSAMIAFDAAPIQTETYRMQINLPASASGQVVILSQNFWVSYSSTP